MVGWRGPRALELCALSLALLAGCEDEQEPGSVAITWRTTSQSCAQAGLAAVEARLYDFTSVEPIVTERGPCAIGELRIPGVAPGAYALVLRGLGAADCWTHQARTDEVTVHGGETTEVRGLLLARRSRVLEISWDFANGAGCGENGVAQVVVDVIVNGVVERSVPSLCHAAPAYAPGVPPGNLHLRVTGYDGTNTAVMQGEVEVERYDECAPDLPLRVGLELCEDPGC
ncbi:MAG: hypothetical protein KC549_09980 [Myxococcales bacterium]|nr:hypothetical protein [Myxococcales bacterium]MCB9548401.1 hypothetical protein [Myxococcales bacterium]